ncbi:hypothetical protein [Micromonospora sp. DT233]|uniref:hypothetical protein n=1 Tax=Micromonospora sp. DT233 TaxID=3393432 RepID=UPI003CF0C9FD
MTETNSEVEPRDDDLSQRQKFDRLRARVEFAAVVEANRAYLQAAVPAPDETEMRGWALSCLPSTNRGHRLSTVNMRRMEVFVLFGEAEGEARGVVDGFVVVRRSLLDRPGWQDSVEEVFPDLAFDAKRPYRDAGEDQIRVWGRHDRLIAALRDEHFATAARELAASLLTGTTNHARHHNRQLADEVLGRDPRRLGG